MLSLARCGGDARGSTIVPGIATAIMYRRCRQSRINAENIAGVSIAVTDGPTDAQCRIRHEMLVDGSGSHIGRNQVALTTAIIGLIATAGA